MSENAAPAAGSVPDGTGDADLVIPEEPTEAVREYQFLGIGAPGRHAA